MKEEGEKERGEGDASDGREGRDGLLLFAGDKSGFIGACLFSSQLHNP